MRANPVPPRAPGPRRCRKTERPQAMRPATARTSEPLTEPVRHSGGPIRAVASRRCTRPVAVYVAAHASLVAVTWLFLARAHIGLLRALEAGDGGWYVAVASLGYEHHLVYVAPGVAGQMRIAFFPL